MGAVDSAFLGLSACCTGDVPALEITVKIFYRINGSRATWREHAFDTPWLLLPVVALIKLFRIRGGGSTDDPPVESVAPFEVEERVIPAEVRERFEPLAQELAALGFGQPIYHQIYHPLYFTYIYWATFLHSTGRAVARIHHRIWTQKAIHKSYLYPVFISEMADGTFVVSSAGRPDLLTPASVQIVYEPGASATELWDRHQRRLDDLLPSRSVTVDTSARQCELIERHHAALRDFHLDRGVFEPALEGEQQEKLSAQCEASLAKAPPPPVEEAVLARLERMPLEKASWRNTILVLAISLMLFLGAGVRDAPTKILWILVGVILFHELGHYVTMRCFGYRNLRMFFIPTFGAAVTGKHYNVSGWKKAVVALMGPIPGIVIGAGLGFAGIWWQRPLLMETALLMLILNGFNLLPFLPLDGGWVLHAVLFCRHPVLDLAFRALAILGTFGLAFLDGRLCLLGILLLIGLPASWRIARTAQRLRDKGVSALSPDALTIPPPTARAILAELGAGKHNRMPANALAQQVVGVFETLNARPPGALASLALLGIHGAGFLGALVLVGVLVFAQREGFSRLFVRPAATPPPPYTYVPGETKEWRGAAAPALPPPSSVTLVAHYPDAQAAQAQFAALSTELPQQASLRWFGQSLLLTLPEDETTETDRWADRVRQQGRDVIRLHKGSIVRANFACVLPSEEKAEQLREELEDYLRAPNNELLLAPWSAAWQTLPREDQQRFRKGRRTLGRLQYLKQEAMQNPEVRAHMSRVPLKHDPRDPDAAREELAAFKQTRDAAEKRLLAGIVAEGEDTADHVIVELWQRWMNALTQRIGVDGDPDHPAEKRKAEAWQRRVQGLMQEMANRMGQLPLTGSKPRPGTNIDTAQFGYSIQKQSSLSIHAMWFRQLDRGLPAFAEWLGQKGCSQIRYGIDITPSEPDEEPDPE